MMDIQLGDEVHFKNGEVSRVNDVQEMYANKCFYLEFTTPVHGFIGEELLASYWGYNPDGTTLRRESNLAGNDIVNVVHKGLDDFLHLYRGDVIITSNGSEAKIAEDAVLFKRYTIVELTCKINVNDNSRKPRRERYINIIRDTLEITSVRGPNTKIIKIIRGDGNEEKDV